MTSFNARSSTINAGSVAGEGRYAINGFPLTAARSGGFSSYVYDTVNADEIAVTVGGGLGESDIGGPIMNIIPRSGGNNFTGTAFYNNAGEWSSGNNLTSEIQALNPNLRENPGVLKTYDWSVSYGGPIMKDRLWFFGNYRDLSGQTAMEGIQANANAGNAARWDWIGSPINARLVQDRTMLIGRVTGQFGKHRVRINSEYQARCEGTPLKVGTKGCHNRGEDWIGLGNNQAPIQMSPEATQTAGRGYFDVPFYVNQGTWTMPANSKLLLEAGVTIFRYQPIFGHPAPDGDTTLTSVTEQSNAINPVTGLRYAPVANYRYRGVESWGPANGKTDDVLGSASYVTGANSIKFGYQYRKLDLLDKDVANSSQLGYRFNQGVPNAVSYYLPDFGRRTVTKTNSFYIQDSLTRGRLTLQGALRYDHASSYAPSELNGTTNTSFLNPQPITIPLTPGVDAYNDLTPRVGVAYDVFGNGRTAVKFNFGKYLAYAANDAPYTSTNPGATVVRNVQNRGWTDIDNDKVVDCDLLNPALNGECAAATGTAPNFGKLGAATAVDPAVLSGWGVRPGDTQYTVTLQQEIRPRLSGEVSFTHRSFTGFFVTDDLNRRAGGVASYYESYTLTAPSDSRLADGGAYPVTVFVPLTNAAPSTILMREKDLGEERDERVGWLRARAELAPPERAGRPDRHDHRPWQGQRLRGHAAVQQCGGRAALTGPNTRGCDNVEPWQTTLRGLVTYTIPKIDVLISTVLRSQPSSAITANWQVPNSVIAGSLGHLPVGATGDRHDDDPAHRQRAPRLRGRAPDAGGHALREGPPVQPHAHRRWRGHQQPVQHELRDRLQPDLCLQHGQYAAPGRLGTPTGLAFPRFVRFNLTFNF